MFKYKRIIEINPKELLNRIRMFNQQLTKVSDLEKIEGLSNSIVELDSYIELNLFRIKECRELSRKMKTILGELKSNYCNCVHYLNEYFCLLPNLSRYRYNDKNRMMLSLCSNCSFYTNIDSDIAKALKEVCN